MRLIDADALIEDLKGSLFYADSIPFVEDAPTAYDVKKVVEQIHEYFKGKIDACDEDIVPYEILEYNKAICEIVRKGGVE